MGYRGLGVVLDASFVACYLEGEEEAPCFSLFLFNGLGFLVFEFEVARYGERLRGVSDGAFPLSLFWPLGI